MKKLAWKQITAGIIIGFFLGGGFGAWQDRQQAARWMQFSSEQKKEQILGRFSRELKLTPDQQAQVKKILNSTYDQTQTLQAEIRPKFRAIRSEMRQEVRVLLTPEQAKRFDVMEAKWDARKRWMPKD